MILDGIDTQTGEMVKPYESEQHKKIREIVRDQQKFITENVFDEIKQKSMLDGQGGDNLVEIMTILNSYIEFLGGWCTDERLRIADLKVDLDDNTAKYYIKIKQEDKETNETARMRAQLLVSKDQRTIAEAKHMVDRVDRWRKTVNSYWETTRSALGYEKSMAFIHSQESSSA